MHLDLFQTSWPVCCPLDTLLYSVLFNL
jgi:hypothetical protein